MGRRAPGKNKKYVDIVNKTWYIQPIGEIGNTFSGKFPQKVKGGRNHVYRKCSSERSHVYDGSGDVYGYVHVYVLLYFYVSDTS